MKVIMYLVDGFEEVEALAVVDVLRRVDIHIEMVSVSGNIYVEGAHNIEVKADTLIDEVDIDDFNMMVLPGGMPGTHNLGKSAKLKEHIIKFNKEKKYIAAICAAPSILGKMNLLEGVKVTCYPGFEKFLRGATVMNKDIVCDDYIITGKGMGVAIKFALKLVEIIKGAEVAMELESQLQVTRL